MRNAVSWWRAALVVAALGIAGQARAQSASGPGATGTGIPQSAQPAVDSFGDPADALKVDPDSAAGVPRWYSVSGSDGTQPDHRPTLVVRQLEVPSWYAVS